ncbi:hypothetical protein HDR61_02280 [bacterium]|nr:hypothetical protein [bacterium]
MNDTDMEKPTWKGALQCLAYAALGAALLSLQQKCSNSKQANTDVDPQTKTVAGPVKNDTIAANARIQMIKNNTANAR